MVNKTTIYLDCDDTILHSSETVIDILNKRYGVNKSIEDLEDWGYRSIVSSVEQEEILDIYDSDEFWDNVKLNERFLKVFKLLKEDYNWVIVTKGRTENLKKKEKFIKEKLNNGKDDFPFVGMIFEDCESVLDFNKSKVDMRHGIQIDDKMECLLGTNAECKVILQNGRETYWNKTSPDEDNLYQAYDWDEIGELLVFFKQHPEFVQRCY